MVTLVFGILKSGNKLIAAIEVGGRRQNKAATCRWFALNFRPAFRVETQQAALHTAEGEVYDFQA